MRRTLAAAMITLGVLAALPARAQSTLTIGDPAPKLEVKEFVKGTPVKAFEPGKTYVVEFWATWCGPCRVSIPHLTELQKKYPGITFVGVSVWENDQAGVKPFVEKMGEKMDYRVAMDEVPKGAQGSEGAMARTWMTAAGERGIPTAFVVNGQGKIAWIGHPMQMDEPLGKIAKGEWNLAEAAAQRKQEQAVQEKVTALNLKLRQAKEPAARLQVVDEALAQDPSLLRTVGFFKLNLMVQLGAEGTADFVNRLAGEFKGNAQALNQLAWSLVDPRRPKPSGPLAKAALETALKADQAAGGKDFGTADTLARAYFVNGDVKNAVAAQERAVRLAEGTEAANDPALKQRLEEYRKAAAP